MLQLIVFNQSSEIKIMTFDESTLSEVVHVLNTSSLQQTYLLCRMQCGHLINFSNRVALRAAVDRCNEFSGISIIPNKILYRFKHGHTDVRDTVEYPDGTLHIQWTEELLLTELGKVGIGFGSYI